ncbi:MAG: ROK family transcriptional regulator [Limisphaerales bacterium]
MRKIDLNHFQVATSETARDINRRIVLNLIREHQPLSRADLSRRSGLQRSTVSAITEELVASRWVTEEAGGALPHGRKPTFLRLNSERAGIIGVDLRPLTTTIALAGLDDRFLAQETFPTGRDPHQFVADLGQRLRNLMRSHPEISYEGVGVALPGRVDALSQRLIFAPNLGWRDLDLKTPLERATGLPVELENDANACALTALWDEHYADGVHDLIAVAVTEGIGVGMVLNGQLVRGPAGMAGEFGHVVVREDGPLCNCGNHGCWESLASNTAALRYYREMCARNPAALSQPRTFEDLLRLAEQNDTAAAQALDRMAHFLGEGIAMLVMGLAPSLVVVFGEVTQAWPRVGPIIEAQVQGRLHTPAKTRIVPTDPAAETRLRGTIALVLQKHFGAPLIA